MLQAEFLDEWHNAIGASGFVEQAWHTQVVLLSQCLYRTCTMLVFFTYFGQVFTDVGKWLYYTILKNSKFCSITPSYMKVCPIIA